MCLLAPLSRPVQRLVMAAVGLRIGLISCLALILFLLQHLPLVSNPAFDRSPREDGLITRAATPTITSKPTHCATITRTEGSNCPTTTCLTHVNCIVASTVTLGCGCGSIGEVTSCKTTCMLILSSPLNSRLFRSRFCTWKVRGKVRKPSC